MSKSAPYRRINITRILAEKDEKLSVLSINFSDFTLDEMELFEAFHIVPSKAELVRQAVSQWLREHRQDLDLAKAFKQLKLDVDQELKNEVSRLRLQLAKAKGGRLD